MRVLSSLFRCLVLTACATSAYGDTVVTATAEPVLGTPVLLGLDENYPGIEAKELAEPVLGSVILIAATSDSSAIKVATASTTILTSATRDESATKTAQEIGSSTQGHLNLLIKGPGYFCIQTPDGTLHYTRRGSFHISSNRQLVNARGFPLHPKITVPADAETITIDQDGVVSVATSETGSKTSVVGHISLCRFENPKGLSAKERLFYSETAESGPAIIGSPGTHGFGILSQREFEPGGISVLADFFRWLTIP